MLSVATVLHAEMSLEDKVGQLIFGFVYGEELNDDARCFLESSRLGNVVYYRWANGLTSPAQVNALSQQLHSTITTITGVAPLIAVDQEGGRVSRLVNGFSSLPSPGVIGASGDPSLAYAIGRLCASELRAVGINMNLAPVVDVASNPDNPVIGDRSFGKTPDVVVVMASQVIAAHQEEGIATVLKHFPGHGDTAIDSHLGLPIVGKSLEQLEAMELLPFKALLGQADAVMTAHLLVPALDPVHPATRSSAILTGLLRQQWGYDGVIISDCLTMRGIAPDQHNFASASAAVTQAALEAILAGCDCVIIGRLEWADFDATPAQNLQLIADVAAALRQAVVSGTLSMERLDASVERLLRLKK